MGQLSRLHKALRTTMIYVTHDQVEAMTLGDRIAVFNKGIIEQLGAPIACTCTSRRPGRAYRQAWCWPSSWVTR